jgi:hypothetical protein
LGDLPLSAQWLRSQPLRPSAATGPAAENLLYRQLGIRSGARRTSKPAAPFAAAFTFDTRLPGNANTGHECGTSLSQPEKMALIEFLKTL